MADLKSLMARKASGPSLSQKESSSAPVFYFRCHAPTLSIIYQTNLNKRIVFTRSRFKTEDAKMANFLKAKFSHVCWPCSEAEYRDSRSTIVLEAIVDAGTDDQRAETKVEETKSDAPKTPEGQVENPPQPT